MSDDNLYVVFKGAVPPDVTASPIGEDIAWTLAAMFEAAETEIQTLEAGSVLTTAAGKYLDLHARDRGLRRQGGEDDPTLKERLIYPPQAVTAPAILESVQAAVDGAGGGRVFMYTLPRDSAFYATDFQYPRTTDEMFAALKYGNWSQGQGWLCNELSGNLLPTFGSTQLTPVSSPTYNNDGPFGDGDRAIGFNSDLDAYGGGNIFDVSGTDDLIITWVGFLSGTSASSRALISKYDGTNGWQVYIPVGTTNYHFQGVNATVEVFNSGSVSAFPGQWHVGILVIERGTGKARIATRSLRGEISIGSEVTAPTTTLSTSANFQLGDLSGGLAVAPVNSKISAAYVVKGIGIAAGLSENIESAIKNFADSIRRSGYPASTAEMNSVVGYTWSHGWSFDIASGNDAGLFGGSSLVSSGSPTYQNIGPLDKMDFAVGFRSGSADLFSIASSSTLDVIATDDLILAGVAKLDTDLANGEVVWLTSKLGDGGLGIAGHVVHLFRNSSTDAGLTLFLDDAVDEVYTNATFAAGIIPVNEWFAWMAVVDRSANGGLGRARIAVRTLSGGVTTISPENSISVIGSITNPSSFTVGGTQNKSWQLSALYGSKGNGIASGLSANLSTAILNFSNAILPQYVALNYPKTGLEMNTIVGYGKWTSGWNFNILSGSDPGEFGGIAMDPTGTPVYGLSGPRGEPDLAVGFDGVSEGFVAGNVLNAGAGDDVILAGTLLVEAEPPANNQNHLAKKLGTSGYLVTLQKFGNPQLVLFVTDGVDSPQVGVDFPGNVIPIGQWITWMAVLERGTNKMRIAMKISSGAIVVSTETDVSAVGSLSNTDFFALGASGSFKLRFSCLYAGVGAGIATGLSANLSKAITNFSDAIFSKYVVSPQYIVRDYPETAVEVNKAVKYGKWKSGWLFNIAGGNDPGAFGSITLTSSSTPTYSNTGPLGGNDFAVGFDSGGVDAFNGGNNFDVGTTDDLIFAGVAKLSADLVNGDRVWLVSKWNGTTGYFVHLYRNSSTDAGIYIYVKDGVDEVYSIAGVPNGILPIGEWFSWISVVERGTNKSRIAIRTFNGVTRISAESSITSIGSLSNASAFIVGSGTTDKSWQCAALYAGTGLNVAAGMSANLEAAIDNFAQKISPYPADPSKFFFNHGHRMGSTGVRTVIVIIPDSIDAVPAVQDALRSKVSAGTVYIVEEYT